MKLPQWPKGSKVRCIEPDDNEALVAGALYTLKQDYYDDIEDYVCVEHPKDSWWFASRFEEVHVTNTPRAGETAEQTAARSAPRGMARPVTDDPRAALEILASLERQAVTVIPETGPEFSLEPGSLNKVMTKSILGTQVGGSHYTDCPIQPIEYIWANGLGFSEGNVIKYVSRWKAKGGIKDLEKAKHHIALLIERATADEAKGTKYGLG